ncbi:hypothetical protein DPMN_079934 [Dreissena polymorpha]|uniref:Uncharacterized protein n=1 Tax=Dreissena polymorpha TaxID=45954 RepID=A0A9D3YT09_DREPO|nr:hypothetical protein DPMN_079934 [Dreissena polymorpha]
MQEQTKIVAAISSALGLFIKRWTSKVFYSNESNGTHITAQYGALEDGEKLNLGSILDKNAGTEADFKTRISNTRGDWSEAYVQTGKDYIRYAW